MSNDLMPIFLEYSKRYSVAETYICSEIMFFFPIKWENTCHIRLINALTRVVKHLSNLRIFILKAHFSFRVAVKGIILAIFIEFRVEKHVRKNTRD